MEEVVSGVRHVRRGSKFGVYYAAYRWLVKTRPSHDILIDHINTVPFFTPLYDSSRTIAYIHQLARDVWFYETPFAIGMVGFIAERLYHCVYRSTPAITVSRSTFKDLRRYGWRSAIAIVPPPIGHHHPRTATKAEAPTLAFVGRLTPSKRVEHAIRAFRSVRAALPQAQLWIIGKATDQGYLQRLQRMAGDTPGIVFLGWLPDDECWLRVSRAHLLFVTSVREGWGLVVTEANAVGTPAVGYAVPGLVDSIKENCGVLVRNSDTRGLADAAVALFQNPQRYATLRENAIRDAQQYRWDATYADFLSALRRLRPHLSI